MHGPLCIALDGRDRARIEHLATVTAPHVGMYKVGLTTFTALGQEFVESLVQNRPVFLDLKLHDIPAQVEGAVRAVADLGVELTTVHAAGGRAMLEAAVAAAETRVNIVAVTVLTSLDDDDLAEVGLEGGARSAVLRLARLALECGVDGLVCSPLEVAALRSEFGPRDDGGPLLVVPGIRPLVGDAASAKAADRVVAHDDQRRTMTPEQAMEAGADIIVVGRPITHALDPGSAAATIARSVHGALA